MNVKFPYIRHEVMCVCGDISPVIRYLRTKLYYLSALHR